MRFDIITIFPNQIESFLGEGIFRIAQSKGVVEINVYNLRDWTNDKHKTVDDRPFGGGAGMIIKIEPIFKAISQLRSEDSKVIITSPRGKKLNQALLKEHSDNVNAHYIILCGHYEGFDERIHKFLADEEISLGDFVLSGGELPALAFIDGVVRLIPGVLGNKESLSEESFEDGLYEYPQYTRPEEFKGWRVPEILVSGNHKEIKIWKDKNRKSL